VRGADCAYDLNTLFGELDGQAFESYGEFDERVRELFARHRSAFPTSYTYRKAIQWARERGLIVVVDDRIRVQAVPAAT